MSMLEAECTRCKEIFVPHGTEPEDLIHCYTEADDECGGIGVIQGMWYGPNEPADDRMVPDRTPQEQHGVDMPNCEDPDCEFHHPEVREFTGDPLPKDSKFYDNINEAGDVTINGSTMIAGLDF